MLPQLELLEAAECCLLACTVAWDASAAVSELPPSASEQAGLGCARAAEAVAQAQRALARLVPPAAEAATAVDVQRLSEAHCPDRQQWQQAVGALLQALEDSSPAPARHQPGTSLVNLDLGLARQEYAQNGQQVGSERGARAGGRLGSLPAALTAVPRMRLGSGRLGRRDGQQGSAAAEARAAAARPSQGLDELLAALSDPLADAPAADGSQGQDQQPSEGLSKVVLARCTTLQVGGWAAARGAACCRSPCAAPLQRAEGAGR
jgi:isochorismate synthase/2-succinyl-5-enolpyruvyl-6-hydroxy-3-cyclohexene-1-carboxylate synthase/2-succinyl-6-hydroxy-2,4-cyclohexadiene-1-carboxylate synthase/O-succinylbenzoate synthase